MFSLCGARLSIMQILVFQQSQLRYFKHLNFLFGYEYKVNQTRNHSWEIFEECGKKTPYEQ